MNRSEPTQGLRHGARERLRFIDSRLFWEARINRADLIGAFAVSPAQAALDFRDYLKHAGRGVIYDTRAKAYVATTEFSPVFGVPDANTVLAGLSDSGDPLIANLPSLERPLDAGVVARVRRAARDCERLLVVYQSFTRAEASRRWIAPARLVSDGERWHARCWCFENHQWRDFVLARIITISASDPAGDVPPDSDWQETVEFELQPAIHLSRGQQASVAREFAMENGRLTVCVPRAMHRYAMRSWRLVPPSEPPSKDPLPIANDRLKFVMRAGNADDKKNENLALKQKRSD